MNLGHHSQLCSSRCAEEVVQPALSYIGKPLMIHLNKVKQGRWKGMTFIPQLHNIYCWSFHLKHEGMDSIVDNFKSSNIIGGTNMIVEKMSDIPVCTKKSLSKCRDRLRLSYEDLQSPIPQIPSQVQDSWASFRQIFLEDVYGGGVRYISPLEEWINKDCQSDASPWHQFQVL